MGVLPGVGCDEFFLKFPSLPFLREKKIFEKEILDPLSFSLGVRMSH